MRTLHLIPRFVLCHIILDIVRPVQAIRSTGRTLEGIPRHFILYYESIFAQAQMLSLIYGENSVIYWKGKIQIDGDYCVT